MRVDDADVLEGDAGIREEAVLDLQLHLADDRQLVLDEEVVVAVDAAADRVLHRENAVRRASRFDGLEDVLEGAARKRLGGRRERQRRGLAVGARLSLVGDAHRS